MHEHTCAHIPFWFWKKICRA